MNRILMLMLAILAVPWLAAPGASCAEDNVVYVYNWTEYMPEGALEQFTEETGIKVVYSTYDSNEAMYAKLKMVGGKGYDVVFPSTYFVNRMAREGLLRKIDKEQISNFASLDKDLLNKSFDPNNDYSLPYAWGGTGMIFNTRDVRPADATKWADLWKPEFAGRVLLQDDLREVFALGLLMDGHSINSTDPAEIEQAYERLKTLVPSVRVFNSDNPRMPYLNEEVSIGMIWTTEAYMAREEAPEDFTFVWPEEGGIFWMDNMCIPAGSENVANAHRFIDFLLREDIAAKFVQEMGAATANRDALELLPDEVRNDPIVFAPARVLQHSDFQNDVGEAIAVYEKYWNMLKAGQ